MAKIPYGRGKYQLTFHSLRRFVASKLRKKGCDTGDIMDVGNWKSVETMRRYGLLEQSAKKRLFQRAAKVLSDGSGRVVTFQGP